MKRVKKRKVSTLIERRRTAAARAMPDVKRLVRKHGRAAVGNCMAKIAAFEREAKRLATMRKEVAALSRRLRP